MSHLQAAHRVIDDPHDPCWIWLHLLALAHLLLLLPMMPGNIVVLLINQMFYTLFLCVLEDDYKESDVSTAKQVNIIKCKQTRDRTRTFVY